jgi:uncharacterized protein (DUF2235 family)
MPKDIVICCDGTGNEIATTISNVLKLYRVLEKSDQQRVYYHPGVGTIGLQNAWGRFKQQARGVLGLATGAGLDEDTLAAYRFLCETWEQGDRVWLFGFSRGAYIVRVLAAFIHVMGLLPPDQIDLAGYAVSTYKKASSDSQNADGSLNDSGLKEAWHFSQIAGGRTIEIEFIGVWDTVASVIVPRQDNFWFDLQTLRFTRTITASRSSGRRSRLMNAAACSGSIAGSIRKNTVQIPSTHRPQPTRISARSGSPASTPMSAAAIPKIKAPFRNFRCCG